MKAGLYDPYLDTLGGGEKYILDIARFLSKSYDTDILWDDITILEKAEKRFDYDFSFLSIKENIFSSRFSTIQRLGVTRRYDLFFFLSDGSIPFLAAKKNILLFHHPMNWVNGKNILTQLKFRNISEVLCYSAYVKQYLDRTFPKPATTLAPYVHIPDRLPQVKKNIILSVGRYTRGANTKKQEILIDTFKSAYEERFSSWKLVLIGAVLPADRRYVEELKERSEGAPIEVIADASYNELMDFYSTSSVYWHASGFGEDLEQFPERAEHFGITTVEAMGHGAVPVVFNAGGQPEIVENKKSGLLWNTTDDLIEKTSILIQNKKFREELMRGARKRAGEFSEDRFNERLQQIIV